MLLLPTWLATFAPEPCSKRAKAKTEFMALGTGRSEAEELEVRKKEASEMTLATGRSSLIEVVVLS